MPRAQPERALHNAVAAFLRVALPPDICWTTVGHGGGGKVRGAQLKAAGVTPGWPDIQLVCPVAFIGIELKSKAGRLSLEQVLCFRRLESIGHKVYVCRSVEEVEAALRDAGVPLKATLGRAA